MKPRVPDIPDAFDVYTVVILRRPRGAPTLPQAELDDLQARHLQYRAGLRQRGVLVANGPFDEQSDESYRGMSIFACDPEQARRLSESDPSVVAGRLAFDVMAWWVAAGSLAFPLAADQVGERRTMPGD
jgi:uncharacterized protein YciI